MTAQNLNPLGRTAEQILQHRVSPGGKLGNSHYHFFQCKSWLDLAQRTHSPSCLHYAVFELRYGIEYLFFELLVQSSELVTEAEYQRCIGDRHELTKLLGKHGTDYQKLADFSAIARRVKPVFPPLHTWDLRSLNKSWGIASEYMHFVGVHLSKHFVRTWVR